MQISRLKNLVARFKDPIRFSIGLWTHNVSLAKMHWPWCTVGSSCKCWHSRNNFSSGRCWKRGKVSWVQAVLWITAPTAFREGNPLTSESKTCQGSRYLLNTWAETMALTNACFKHAWMTWTIGHAMDHCFSNMCQNLPLIAPTSKSETPRDILSVLLNTSRQQQIRINSLATPNLKYISKWKYRSRKWMIHAPSTTLSFSSPQLQKQKQIWQNFLEGRQEAPLLHPNVVRPVLFPPKWPVPNQNSICRPDETATSTSMGSNLNHPELPGPNSSAT